MDVCDRQSASERDWFAEFHDEQSLLLDPPAVISAPQPHLAVAPRQTGSPLRTTSVSATVLQWLFDRMA